MYPRTISTATAHQKFGAPRRGPAFRLTGAGVAEFLPPPLRPIASPLTFRATPRVAHIALPRLGKALRTKNIYDWARKGFLPITVIDNQKFVSRQFANHLLSDWRHSVTPTQATRLLGITEGQMYGLIRQQIVKTINVFGYHRVLPASIKQAREVMSRREHDIAFPQRRGFARFSSAKHREWGLNSARSPRHHRWNSEEARAAGSRGGRSIEPRIANLSKGQFFNKLNKPFPDLNLPALTRAHTAKLLGVSRSTICRWIAAGQLSLVCSGGRSAVTVEAIRQLRDKLQLELSKAFRLQRDAKLAEMQARLITCGEASKMLGIRAWQVLTLFYKGYLPGELVEDRPMVYRSAVEARVVQAAHYLSVAIRLDVPVLNQGLAP